MSASAPGRRDPADGLVARVCDGVHRLAALELCLLLTCAPGILLTTALVPDPSNAVLFALAGLPVGPALAAAVHSLHRGAAGDDTGPFAAFARGLRATARDALRVWLVVVAVAGFLALDVTVALAGGAAAVVPVLGLLLAVVLVAGVLAVCLTTAYRLRTRDALRLGVWSLAGAPVAALAVLAVLALTVVLTLTTAAWAPALAAAGFAVVLAAAVQPLVEVVGDRFPRSPTAGGGPRDGRRRSCTQDA